MITNTPKMVKKIKKLASQFKIDKEISKILNISLESVKYIRKKHNIKNGSAQECDKLRIEINELNKLGLTFRAISRLLDIGYKKTCYIAKTSNIKPNWNRRSYLGSYDRIRGYMIRNVKFGSKRRGLKFDLDYKDIDLPEFCPILEVKLKYKGNWQDPFYATLDRINNSKGYIKGNVIVMSRLANCMKNSASFSQINTFCKNITKLIKYQGSLGKITDIFPNIKILKD